MNLFELFGTISINSSVANQTIDDTMKKVDELKGEMEGAEKQSAKTNKIFGKGGTLNSASVFVGNLYTKAASVVSKVGTALVKTGFGFDASMEAYRNQFESLLGDADKAKQLVADLNTLAKVSPLGMEGLANNAVSLLNTGTELAEIIPTLEMLGNLSLGDTNKMNSVVRAYAQIMSKGQLYAEEINQLGDAGVPIRQIMTLYGGDRFEDGSWYQEKLAHPKEFIIEASEMSNAFMKATAEGGKWHDYMFNMMDTWNGQVDRMGEEGKESLGSFFQPFFDVAKTDVLPKLAEGLATFGKWASENKESLSELAKSLGNIAVAGFDKALTFFTWMVENKEEASAAFSAIAVAVGALVATTHPWLAAISAVLAGLVEVASLQKEINEFEGKYGLGEPTVINALENQNNVKKTGLEFIRMLNETMPNVEVGAELQDGAGNDLQNELDGQNLAVDVKVNPIWSAFLNFNKKLGIIKDEVPKADGSHANGLDYVPFDNYRAILHRGEAVLTASEAKNWRDGQNSNGELASMVAAAVRDAVAGIQFNIALDGAALVGHLAPRMDQQLGIMANRKGRA